MRNADRQTSDAVNNYYFRKSWATLHHSLCMEVFVYLASLSSLSLFRKPGERLSKRLLKIFKTELWKLQKIYHIQHYYLKNFPNICFYNPINYLFIHKLYNHGLSVIVMAYDVVHYPDLRLGELWSCCGPTPVIIHQTTDIVCCCLRNSFMV